MISHLDHLVLTVEDIQRTLDFYTNVLGMKEITFGKNRKALLFGNQKINCHQVGSEIHPHANIPKPGSSDLCFISDIPLHQFIEHLKKQNIDILDGPVERTGATSKLLSVYFRDPDKNLIEVSNILNSSKSKNVFSTVVVQKVQNKK